MSSTESSDKFLNLDNVSPGVRSMQIVRGPLIAHATQLKRELDEVMIYYPESTLRLSNAQLRLPQGAIKPFKEIFYCDIGDSQAMGQQPVTFIRQVISLSMNAQTQSFTTYPKDVTERVTYSGEAGIPLVRQHIAEFIARRDGGVPSSSDIICSNGASGAIKDVLSLFRGSAPINGLPTGVLTPVPQYPLYGSVIYEFDMHQVPYHLNEDNNWSLEVADDLENVINAARKVCLPRVLVVINPGNPTGQVLSRDCMEEIVKLAHREKLFIFADEVYQQNVYRPEAPFHSFKKVLVELGAPYASMELASFMSVSKGYAGECGLRGGYTELFNLSPDIRSLFNVLLQTQLCPSAVGQLAMDGVAKEPVPGEESYELFEKEKDAILGALQRRAELATKSFNSCVRMSCTPVMGAMYAFPRIHLPGGAIEAARELKLAPDAFYAIELLKSTGICTAPGYVFGQRDGTYHLRITILAEEDRYRKCLLDFKRFNDAFMQKYDEGYDVDFNLIV